MTYWPITLADPRDATWVESLIRLSSIPCETQVSWRFESQWTLTIWVGVPEDRANTFGMNVLLPIEEMRLGSDHRSKRPSVGKPRKDVPTE
jgi:hypothetical protein